MAKCANCGKDLLPKGWINIEIEIDQAVVVRSICWPCEHEWSITAEDGINVRDAVALGTLEHLMTVYDGPLDAWGEESYELSVLKEAYRDLEARVRARAHAQERQRAEYAAYEASWQQGSDDARR